MLLFEDTNAVKGLSAKTLQDLSYLYKHRLFVCVVTFVVMYTCWWDWGFGYRECFRKQGACRQKTWPPQSLLLGAASTCFSTRHFIFSTPDTTVSVVPQVHGHARVTGMSQMSFCDNRVRRGIIKLHCSDVNEAVYLSLWRCVWFVSGLLVYWGFLKCTLIYIPWRLL